MKHGDLIYIPQDVMLFDGKNIFIDKTQKPILGVFLKETPAGSPWQSGTYTVYAMGREAIVERRACYPVTEGAYAD
jgi:hypothetical protein|tara:strand:- start:2649 stop:2876 length:228 start_codon:yes stop_codon:yes gene_type:complete